MDDQHVCVEAGNVAEDEKPSTEVARLDSVTPEAARPRLPRSPVMIFHRTGATVEVYSYYNITLDASSEAIQPGISSGLVSPETEIPETRVHYSSTAASDEEPVGLKEESPHACSKGEVCLDVAIREIDPVHGPGEKSLNGEVVVHGEHEAKVKKVRVYQRVFRIFQPLRKCFGRAE